MGKLALAAKITHVPSIYLSELDGPRKGTRQDAIDGLKEILLEAVAFSGLSEKAVEASRVH